jgi:hypothetical protein
MNYKDDQYRNISAAVMEQLGIEEDEDPLEIVPYELMTEEIVDLKEQIESKDKYIHKLEVVVEHLAIRMNNLEKLFYEFKSREVSK